jgi:DNA-binding MarR family transcriptional regulator
MRNKAPVDMSPATDACFDIMVETARTFFLLRSAAKRSGAFTQWGGGLWGFVNSLRTEGPQTIPQIAKARPVARQRIQRLAHELADAGLIEFIDNPAHRRSKLLRLTAKGVAFSEKLDTELAVISERLAASMDPEDLRITANTLVELSERLRNI